MTQIRFDSGTKVRLDPQVWLIATQRCAPCNGDSATPPDNPPSTGSCNFNFGNFVQGGAFAHWFPDVDFGAF